ncbi:hypothetical protein P5673_012705 [Acropora cervicornis]|uniref:Uncharacterized protein n=1 Tax=Acropora cervicornis TaxID=6130 RepID=A0AAD9V7L4_ACRCE|nr:hypothetical protein P5673_012705 [Acropora cervicornis]
MESNTARNKSLKDMTVWKTIARLEDHSCWSGFLLECNFVNTSSGSNHCSSLWRDKPQPIDASQISEIVSLGLKFSNHREEDKYWEF